MKAKLMIALVLLQGGLVLADDPAAEIAALRKQIEALDQKVKILELKNASEEKTSETPLINRHFHSLQLPRPRRNSPHGRLA